MGVNIPAVGHGFSTTGKNMNIPDLWENLNRFRMNWVNSIMTQTLRLLNESQFHFATQKQNSFEARLDYLRMSRFALKMMILGYLVSRPRCGDSWSHSVVT